MEQADEFRLKSCDQTKAERIRESTERNESVAKKVLSLDHRMLEIVTSDQVNESKGRRIFHFTFHLEIFHIIFALVVSYSPDSFTCSRIALSLHFTWSFQMNLY